MARCIVLFGLFIVVAPGAAGEKEEKIKLPFTLGKETSFIHGPFMKDGRLDYAAALNDRLRPGVTPENNAYAQLTWVIGPRPEGARLSARFYKLLGIQEPAAKGDYFLDLFAFAKDKLKIDTAAKSQELIESQDQAAADPWQAPRHPIIAQWLKANENALNRASEAVLCERYYFPLVPGDAEESLVTVLLPGVQKCRTLCQAFQNRAMLHLGEGRFAEAWQDLLACHRLGRCVGKGATLIEGLVGVAIDAVATGGTLRFLEHAKLDAKMAQDCLRDLQALPPLAGASHQIHLCERFFVLQSVQRISRPDAALLRETTRTSTFEGIDMPEELLRKTDWDMTLKQVNQAFDRLAAATGAKDVAQRRKKMADFLSDMEKMRQRLHTEEAAKALYDKKTLPVDRGRVLGESLLALLMPSVAKVQNASDRAEQIQRNLQVAFALVAHQRDNGNYPKKLAELAPKYLAAVPADVFSGKDLIYRPTKDGFLVYSVGANGIDEDGRYYDDDPAGDDVNVRLPRRRK